MKKIFLTLSILFNIVALGTILLYFYTPFFDFAVVNKSTPRLCEYLQKNNPEIKSPLCKFERENNIKNLNNNYPEIKIHEQDIGNLQYHKLEVDQKIVQLNQFPEKIDGNVALYSSESDGLTTVYVLRYPDDILKKKILEVTQSPKQTFASGAVVEIKKTNQKDNIVYKALLTNKKLNIENRNMMTNWKSGQYQIQIIQGEPKHHIDPKVIDIYLDLYPSDI